MKICKALTGTVLAVGLSLVSLAVPASAFEFRQFGDWGVSCDNAYDCTISFNPATAPADKAGLSGLQWHRTIDPSSPLLMSLPFPPGFSQKADAKGNFTIAVDGVERYSVAVKDLSRDDVLGTFGVKEPDGLRSLFSAMTKGRVATISFSGAAGVISSDIKLDGLEDGGRFIDNLQERNGRTDALIAFGATPPPTNAPVHAIDSLSQLPDSVLRNLSDEKSVCYTTDDQLAQADAFSFETSTGTAIILPCGPSGAYNQPYQIYVGNGEAFHRSEFPNVSDAGITVLETVYNVSFDLKERKLTSVYLGRGLGDCGVAHYWNIDDSATGNPLVLTEERGKSACDGSGVGADKWPVTWSADQRDTTEK
ncbi:DUF1176 domain-containing protein [Martelella sp. HB161492]|uniref:DUF1176 domain-containing protein n=1 Tax=Martelella sp. HB161492 TaxID=2720726 RepID=UPI0015917536|nr:DUF1176 domain-containing protein [Martelella sp. HB161492]